VYDYINVFTTVAMCLWKKPNNTGKDKESMKTGNSVVCQFVQWLLWLSSPRMPGVCILCKIGPIYRPNVLLSFTLVNCDNSTGAGNSGQRLGVSLRAISCF